MYKNQPSFLTEEFFKNPGSEYRATPFWAWNCKLDADELVRQIEVFKRMGYGGFHMHVRTGLDTPYLSGEYMEMVRTCVEKARSENMLAWLYDEDRWPSGAAGGLVTKDERYRQTLLRLTRTYAGEEGLLACYHICLDADGALEFYRRAETGRGFKLYAYMETTRPSGWYNNQTYVNTLDPAAIAEFIKVTYERYLEYFAKDFGGVIPAVFTDEPQFSGKQTLAFAESQEDITLPWTRDLPDTFAAAYPGENILETLPELIWQLPDGRVSVTRYHYHDHVTERFASAFADQCGGWCEKHGLMLTGHMLHEETLESQSSTVGEAMRSLRSFQLPGIDMLCDNREYTTAKQAQSAARQYGRPGVLSELYGVTNWDFDFRGHKLAGDWQAALGVTVRVPHLSWVSMAGEAKRDYPATFNYQVPWHEEYPYIEDHFARVASALTRGKAVVRVGVIHPVESYWLYWGVQEHTQMKRRQLDENFQNITEWLLRGLVDFDFISEALLPGLCPEDGLAGDRFPVGEQKYDAVIVPGCETLRSTTLRRLENFREKGGRVIFMQEPPKYVDAVLSPRGAMLFEKSERIPFERCALLEALKPLREVDIRDEAGNLTNGLIYQLREEEACRWLFIAQADAPYLQELTAPKELRVRLAGLYGVTLYNTLTGEISSLEYQHKDGKTLVNLSACIHDSFLLRMDKNTEPARERPKDAEWEACEADVVRVPVTLSEPNVLLLDIAEYSLDGENYYPAEEILRLDNIARERLGWGLRTGRAAQPWIEKDESTPETLWLRCTFESEVEIKDTRLALENAAGSAIRLNGAEVRAKAEGFYVDKAIGCVALPPLRKGWNTLEIIFPYGRKTDVEAAFLLGDFGVSVAGRASVITAPVKSLAFGDITRQRLPFYGGNVTYHIPFKTAGSVGSEEPHAPQAGVRQGQRKFRVKITAGNYRAALLSVAVDGKPAGRIVFSPYCVEVDGLSEGGHVADITCFGTRVNTFGQLHCADRKHRWWGPDSWRTTGDRWTYEYLFWPQGILKAPELLQRTYG
ncbi:MAG: hypothetical protein LBS62_05005 [Clostridiales bacterium]|jgi:hypothetical protein|nr:hypothetical protein [Clostridiales bacterium]